MKYEKEILSIIENCAVKKIKKDGESHIFDFTVDYMNRTEEPKEAFILDILYEGKLSDSPEIEVTGKGIIIREYERSNRPNQSLISIQNFGFYVLLIFVLITVLILITVFMIGPVITLFNQKYEIKRNKKYAEQLVRSVIDNGSHPFNSEDEIKEFVINTLYRRQCNWYEPKSNFTKWSLAFISPKKSDYEY